MTEIWKDIEGYEGSYQVSNLGRVKSLNRVVKSFGETTRKHNGRIMTPTIRSGGYFNLFLCRKSVCKIYKVHRIVAKAFCEGYKEELQVNHIDGDKLNNRSDNLEWCTAKQNSIHAFATGLNKGKKGEEHGNNRLTELEVRKIKANEDKLTVRKLAKKFNVSEGAVNGILRGTSWRHLDYNHSSELVEI